MVAPKTSTPPVPPGVEADAEGKPDAKAVASATTEGRAGGEREPLPERMVPLVKYLDDAGRRDFAQLVYDSIAELAALRADAVCWRRVAELAERKMTDADFIAAVAELLHEAKGAKP